MDRTKEKLPSAAFFLTGWNKTQCMNWSSSRFSKTNFSPNSWLVLLPLIDAKCGPNLVIPNERSPSELLKLVQNALWGGHGSDTFNWSWFLNGKTASALHLPFRCVFEELRNAKTSKQDGRIILSAKPPNWLHQFIKSLLSYAAITWVIFRVKKLDVAWAYPNKMPWLIY